MSRQMLEKIERVLAKPHLLADEEPDFIVNHDIKYRVRLGGGDEDE